MYAEPTLGDTLADNALRFGDVCAYRAGGRELTHAELYQQALRLASALGGTGVRRQDRVALLGRNGLEFGQVLAAGQCSGIVVATVNFRLAGPEVVRILADATPRVLFVDSEFLPLVEDGLPATVEEIVVLDGPDGPGRTGFATFLARGTATPPAGLRARADDIACLIYTSGTTGRPKGCILGQRELRRVARAMNVEMRAGCADRALLVMPMFHIGAMAIGLGMHARGGGAVLHRQFDPAGALAAVAADDVTVLHLAPTMLQALLDRAAHPDTHRDDSHRDDTHCDALGGVRTVVYSAAPITGPTLAAALAAMPRAGFLNLYGQTEVITSSLPRELHTVGGGERDRRRLLSVGHPFPDTAVRLVDDAGADVEPGAAGEIVVRSPAAFRGYWNDHALTAETLRDGWCHTGDIGRMDDEGLLHLVDRKKDVVISGGENVYSQEVESAVATHPGVAACAVIGVPDAHWGEAVCAVVVPVDGVELTVESLADHVRGLIARYKVPRRVIVVDALPVLATGKVDKKRLRADHGRQPVTASTPPGRV